MTAKTGETTFTTPSDREFCAIRAFDAPRELVWEAYTEPRHLQEWMGGYEGWEWVTCEVDLRPGGAYRFEWRKDDGSELAISGVHQVVEPPERLVTTESWGPGWPEALNTLLFVEEDGITTLSVNVLYPSQEARDAAIATGMSDGMSVSLDRLDRVLAGLR
jgi:uncharacterized protein YndB with AHSA1/START domain